MGKVVLWGEGSSVQAASPHSLSPALSLTSLLQYPTEQIGPHKHSFVAKHFLAALFEPCRVIPPYEHVQEAERSQIFAVNENVMAVPLLVEEFRRSNESESLAQVEYLVQYLFGLGLL